MQSKPTRRRVISMLAATAAGLAGLRSSSAQSRADLEWHGTAMGSPASILFCGADPAAARAALESALAEIERLEDAFSLFRPHSDICRLNRDGVLTRPSGDMRRALGLALGVAAASGGLFDPTVQALWEAHADWFAARPDGEPPPDAIVTGARAAVDWRRVSLAPELIKLGAGQGLTLNGLGQGYVTDRVADVLRARGFDHVLVDLGEQQAIGRRHDGEPWTVARAGASPILLAEGALATSEGAGCVLGAGGDCHHLFDPRTGRSARHWRRITVHHRSAALADALSTALYAASPAEIEGVAARLAALEVWATDQAGRERYFFFPSGPN